MLARILTWHSRSIVLFAPSGEYDWMIRQLLLRNMINTPSFVEIWYAVATLWMQCCKTTEKSSTPRVKSARWVDNFSLVCKNEAVVFRYCWIYQTNLVGSQNWLLWQSPLRDRKMDERWMKISHRTNKFWKFGEDRSSSLWDYGVRSWTTKNLRNKEKTLAEYTARSAGRPSWLRVRVIDHVVSTMFSTSPAKSDWWSMKIGARARR